MDIVADLHLHSKYSRAVSPRMNIPQMVEWGKKKGIGLLATTDWTHPTWLKELKANLKEAGVGVYVYKKSGPRFILGTEISSIYSQGGKGRRIHNLVFAPNFKTVEKINSEFLRRGFNLMSDGRPIIGFSSRDLVDLVMSIDENCFVIPAHCLLPDENVHVQDGIKPIKKVKVGDSVYTHENRWQKVEKIFTRPFKGRAYRIIPDYFRLGLTVTSEHPFWAIKGKKGCRSISQTLGLCRPLCPQKDECSRLYFKDYKPEWLQAKNLEKGDVLLFPRFPKTQDKKFIKISEIIKDFIFEEQGKISAGGSRRHKIPNKIRIDEKFCRLAGYYLAEGYTTRDLVSFCFHKKEKQCLEEVKSMIKELFGIEYYKEYQRRDYQSIELTFFSKVLHRFFSNLFYENSQTRKANNKCLPDWMVWLPLVKQKEILLGWWRGDKGYTTSRKLMNQMKIICLRLGIIPSIGKDSKEDHAKRGKHDRFEGRNIKAIHDVYHFSNLSFFDSIFNLLDYPVFKKFKTRMKRRRGWIDKNYVYLPIRKITKEDYCGSVYNLEVKKDNSYTAEFACVHNCWTPWFSLYGSKSGFDSIKECFQDMSKHIFAIETGLSSSPEMNWRIKDLDKRSIVSFSDAHSPEKMGRELTVLKIKSLNYLDIKSAIEKQKIAYTIEFYPEEGKYHYTGHRKCGVCQSPKETEKLGTICPVCGKPLTVGVMHRVEQLANRPIGFQSKNRPPYVMLVPLMEILAEALQIGVSSQKVVNEYNNLIKAFGSELEVLTRTKPEEIIRVSNERVSEGVKKVRAGDLAIESGYDGIFGKVKIWGEKKRKPQKQISLF